MQTSTIKPGLLVGLKTSLQGNVAYNKVDIERSTAKAKWETTRTISNPAEFERAKEVRSQAVYAIRRVCSVSVFGLLCPENQTATLEAAIQQAQDLIANFNKSATDTRLNLYVVAGKIEREDVQAMRAINSEVKDLLAAMAEGVKNLNVKAIRQAANKAKQVADMLSPEAEAKVGEAIKAARIAARKLAKAGEVAALKVDQIALKQIMESRTMFLDVSDVPEVQEPIEQSRTIDFDSFGEVQEPEILDYPKYDLGPEILYPKDDLGS